MPVRLGLPQARCGSGIGLKAQQHERRRSPIRPVTRLTCGPDEAPQPRHCRSGSGHLIIAGARDHGNHNIPRDLPPVAPAVELGEIVGPHQPDEAAARIAALQPAKGVDRVARAELALDRGRADRRAARLFAGRGEAGGERGHSLGGLERVARRNQPPDLVESQCVDREQTDRAMAAMRRVERAAEQSGGGRSSQLCCPSR